MGKRVKKEPVFIFSPFLFDPIRRILAIRETGERILPPEKALAVLEVLVRNRGKLVTKDDLLDQVWAGTAVELNNVDQQINTLRKMLGDTPRMHKYILTVPREGYKFVAPVKIVDLIEIEAPPEATDIVKVVASTEVAAPFKQGQGPTLEWENLDDADQKLSPDQKSWLRDFAAGLEAEAEDCRRAEDWESVAIPGEDGSDLGYGDDDDYDAIPYSDYCWATSPGCAGNVRSAPVTPAVAFASALQMVGNDKPRNLRWARELWLSHCQEHGALNVLQAFEYFLSNYPNIAARYSRPMTNFLIAGRSLGSLIKERQQQESCLVDPKASDLESSGADARPKFEDPAKIHGPMSSEERGIMYERWVWRQLRQYYGTVADVVLDRFFKNSGLQSKASARSHFVCHPELWPTQKDIRYEEDKLSRIKEIKLILALFVSRICGSFLLASRYKAYTGAAKS